MVIFAVSHHRSYDLRGSTHCCIENLEAPSMTRSRRKASKGGAAGRPGAGGLSPFARGNRSLHEGRHLEAVRLLRQASRAPGTGAGKAGDHRVHFNLGYALAQTGRHLAASRAFRRCLDLRPGDVDAWFNLGNAYREAGALRRAKSAYAEAASIDSSDHEIWNNLGNVRAALGEGRAAIDAYRAALALQADYHPAWNNLGNAWQSLGDPAKALACYDRALALQGGSDQIYHFNRALALLAAGRESEALREIGRFAALSPFLDTDARTMGGPGWLRFLQSLAPSRARREVR